MNDNLNDNPASLLKKVVTELRRKIVGQDNLIEKIMVALLSDGHVLLEGVPGLAKTRTLTAFTEVLSASMMRIQFTPDLLPSDVVGTEVYRPDSATFEIRKGPVFTNLLLADEINRAPAKVQSALLQAMQEREVSIGEQTFVLPDPFMVLATQNPIEQEGTYPLPEAQLDRFLMKVHVTYPDFEEEIEIVKMVTESENDNITLEPILTLEQLKELRRQAAALYSDPKIDRYIVSIVHATREAKAYGLDGMIEWGASPRASIALKSCARSLAFLRGKDFVSPDEVKSVAFEVLRHRILVTFEAEARGVTSDEIIRVILNNVTVP
ncbi:MAG: MoxR family ATPase [Candidatus Dadabacteria bacterium]|nr:MAG: MoxR family ATPase [Candidatus Dadabacteria bacterium]